MSRRRAAALPAATQDQPTRPPERDAWGFVLDEWGLPVSGPARAAILDQSGRPDPNHDPEGWLAATSDGDPTPVPPPEPVPEPVPEPADAPAGAPLMENPDVD